MDPKYNIDFVHFQSEELVEKFVVYLKELNISISHKCCNGKGVGIIINNIMCDNIVEKFKNKLLSEIEINLITTEMDICCVCREPTDKALSCLTPHHICEVCVVHIKNECPCCRRNLVDLNLNIF